MRDLKLLALFLALKLNIMRNLFQYTKYLGLATFILLFASSCSKEKTISDELVGEWLYERETFRSSSTFEDQDTRGTMSFLEDETGRWTPVQGFSEFDIEWDLQSNDTKISITKVLEGTTSSYNIGLVYDLNRNDEDSFTFTRHIKFESPIDSLEDFEQFENIILTRLE